MATPRTVVLPLQVSTRGGAPLTSTASQGSRAIEQQLIVDLQGDRNTKNPWLQGRASLSDSIFAQDATARIDVEAYIVSLFDRYEALERARLVGPPGFERGEGAEEGRVFVRVNWINLRLQRERQQQITTRLELT